MSIADLKSRMLDVPGIEGLKMRLDAGRQVFEVGGVVTAVGAFASDHEIETAIRKALRLPSVAVIPDRKAEPMTVTGAGFLGGSIKAKIQAAKDRIAAGHSEIDAALSKLDSAAEQSAKLARSISDEADSLLADIGQFTNGAPE